MASRMLRTAEQTPQRQETDPSFPSYPISPSEDPSSAFAETFDFENPTLSLASYSQYVFHFVIFNMCTDLYNRLIHQYTKQQMEQVTKGSSRRSTQSAGNASVGSLASEESADSVDSLQR